MHKHSKIPPSRVHSFIQPGKAASVDLLLLLWKILKLNSSHPDSNCQTRRNLRRDDKLAHWIYEASAQSGGLQQSASQRICNRNGKKMRREDFARRLIWYLPRRDWSESELKIDVASTDWLDSPKFAFFGRHIVFYLLAGFTPGPEPVHERAAGFTLGRNQYAEEPLVSHLALWTCTHAAACN
jgi:hypothetical protein